MASTENLAEKAVAPAAAAAPGATEVADFRKNLNYPLIKFTDMADEMRAEVVDAVVTTIEKFPGGNYEAAAKALKELLDKKFGTSWHVVIGEGYAFEITHEQRHLVYMYFNGLIGILVWKCS